jgi:hypothetical protein
VADLVDQLLTRRAGRRSARRDDGGPARSGGGCPVFGHGIPFPVLQW